jgi:hypothetical protein
VQHQPDWEESLAVRLSEPGVLVAAGFAIVCGLILLAFFLLPHHLSFAVQRSGQWYWCRTSGGRATRGCWPVSNEERLRLLNAQKHAADR